MSDFVIKIDERELYDVCNQFYLKPESECLNDIYVSDLHTMFYQFMKFLDAHELNKSNQKK